jgi:hypothetical protein
MVADELALASQRKTQSVASTELKRIKLDADKNDIEHNRKLDT